MSFVSSKQPQAQQPAQPTTAPQAQQYRTPPTQDQSDAFRRYLSQNYGNKLTPTQRADYFKQQIASALLQQAAPQSAQQPMQQAPQPMQSTQQQQASPLIMALMGGGR